MQKLSFEAGKDFESIDTICTIGTICTMSSGERMVQCKLPFEAGKNFESIGNISSEERMVQHIRSVVDMNKVKVV